MPTEIHTQVEYLMPILVDIGVLPLVEALNRHPDIQTNSSCQGNSVSDIDRRTNVQFIASRDGLFYLIGVLQEFPAMLDWEICVNSRSIYDLYVAPSDIEMVAKAIRGVRNPYQSEEGHGNAAEALPPVRAVGAAE